MKKLEFIDYPKYYNISEYEHTIHRIINKFKSDKNLISIYQIGSISNPGISDIDLLFIFKDNIKIKINPKDNLNNTDLYLLVHECFGTSEEFFIKAQKFSFFHNYNLLFGKQLLYNHENMSKKELKIQIALEYMVKMYITLTVQLTYGIIKLRSILLEIKAILYDLEFLEITNSELNNLVKYFIKLRKSWFDTKTDEYFLTSKILEFYNELEHFLKVKLNSLNLYTKNNEIVFSKNIKISYSKQFAYKTKTILKLPLVKYFNEKKQFNILHRFNSFVFYVPMRIKRDTLIINSYFDYITLTQTYNKNYLPYFSPLVSSFVAK